MNRRTPPRPTRGTGRVDPLDDLANVPPELSPPATPSAKAPRSQGSQRTEVMANEQTIESRILDGMSSFETLDILSNPVMLADADMVIRHVNEAGYEMFERIEADIRRDLPNFRARDVLGKSIDMFHTHPQYQRGIMHGMVEPHDGKFTVGGRHLAFRATPKFTKGSEIGCIFVEWQDQTEVVVAKTQTDRLVADLAAMTASHHMGDIDHFVSVAGYEPAFATVATEVNDMVREHIETKKKVVGCLTEIANGNFDAKLETFPGKKVFLNVVVEEIRDNLKNNKAQIDKLLTEIRSMAAAHHAGDIDEFVDSEGFDPAFASVVNDMNAMVLEHIETKKKVVLCLAEIAKGNFAAHLEKFPRKKAFLNDVVEDMRKNFTAVINEIERLSNAIVDGSLDVQPDRGRFEGDFVRIVDAFDSAFVGLNGAFNLIGQQIGQVATTVEQMSQSSQALATNSQVQSSSVDEVSASAEQTDAQVKSNAAAATKASQLVVGASEVAEVGKGKINEMVTAMQGIRASSQDIGKIIKVIDEIAFQTNLLALNAAVEAARAGQHGRGFAVVAQEVRNLAGRSAKAARETSELIEDAATRVQSGVKIADETSRAFVSIADDIEKVKGLVTEIATASDEQARGVAQINIAIGEIAKSALSTSQQAEELAASSNEMQAATESMRSEIARYRLRKVATRSIGGMSLEGVPADLMAQIQAMIAGQMGGNRGAQSAPAPARAAATGGSRNSDRDQRGFGNF
ncbi:methyl-accepting chemotaxis protein [Gemmobacter aquarius]|uniref:Methyl-accepting chemotaxis protein n=1 Tax=Paragemmobacter aquarius TaxID=2169400 RepID=A0A2S0UPD9_9RHOB|nr:methyl-accepting chemotaxis protein [Gemmobacter aquarius]AWB49688.1 methyl-accepting chemotaxis protein [Gemmobacter aquarius]